MLFRRQGNKSIINQYLIPDNFISIYFSITYKPIIYIRTDIEVLC